jgi:hypothetical protein
VKAARASKPVSSVVDAVPLTLELAQDGEPL